MNLKKSKIFKGMSVLLASTVILAVCNISDLVVNADEKVKNSFQSNGYLVEKISNPTTGEGDTDGIILGGDRNNSYAWAMTERDGYIYIGTNRNILGGMCSQFAQMLAQYGMTYDQVWSIVDAISNGEIPRFDATKTSPQIIKVNPKTSETTIVYEAPIATDTAYRMVVNNDGKLYFGSMGKSGTRIVMVDEDDNTSIVYEEGGSSSFRAGTVYKNKVYFGGLDNRITDNGSYNKLAIIEKDSEDDSNWNRVADYKDFIDYASDTLYQGEGGTVWDLIEYNDELYVFLATSNGFVLFKGHEALEEESANEYGWVWTEVIGKNSEYNMGMATTKEGYNVEGVNGLLASAATPVVFNGKLYFGDFDYALKSILQGVTGILQNIGGDENAPKLSEILQPMYTSLNNPQKMYVLSENGLIEEVSGINDIFENTSNEYFWRYTVYNDKLFVSSFDASSLYKYITKLTNGDLVRMSDEELSSQINYIVDMIVAFDDSNEIDEYAQEIKDSLQQYQEEMKGLLTLSATTENVDKLIEYSEEYYNSIVSKLDEYIESSENEDEIEIIKSIKTKLEELWSKLDVDGLKMYVNISNKLNHDEYGFDLYVTEDGENYTPITVNGFNDKFNYGGRTLVPTESGLFVGTANPFYGAQLWKITEKSEVVVDPEDPIKPSIPEDSENTIDPEQNETTNNVSTNNNVNVSTSKPTTSDKNNTLLWVSITLGTFGIVLFTKRRIKKVN